MSAVKEKFDRWFARSILPFLAATVLVLGSGCESSGGGGGHDFGDRDPSKIAVAGDSISVGYGDAGTPWPSRLAAKLDRSVINFGFAGAASSDARSMVSSALSRDVGFIIISIGANDAIMGYGEIVVHANLATMIAQIKSENAVPVVGNVIGMSGGHALYNGSAERINAVISKLCKSEGVELVDLYSVVKEEMLQADGLHPDSDGQEAIARAFYNKLKKRVR